MIIIFFKNNIWLICTPLVLFSVAFLNFFIINDKDYEPLVLIMPIIVGLVIGALVQTLLRHRVHLKEINNKLQQSNRVLKEQQAETNNTILRMQRIQGGSLVAIGSIHDIRNILTPIMMGIDLLTTSNDKEKQLLSDMESSATRCLELTNKILRTLKNNDYTPQLCRIDHELPLLWKRVQSILPGQVNVSFDLTNREVFVDLDDLMQVVHNLALNAYNILGSELVIQIIGFDNGPNFCIDIKDNGPGLPKHIMDNLGKVNFNDENQEVHGLGLSIVQSLLKRNQINLEVQSSPLGTTFRLIFKEATLA